MLDWPEEYIRGLAPIRERLRFSADQTGMSIESANAVIDEFDQIVFGGPLALMQKLAGIKAFFTVFDMPEAAACLRVLADLLAAERQRFRDSNQ